MLAARAKAKKDADDQFMKDAEAMAKQVIAADEARRKAQAAALSDAPLQAQAGSNTPVPLPENAQEVDFDGDDGRLEFNSTSSVKALAAFYRASLKQAGWKEQPSVINQPNMAVMEFAKGGKSISMTVMQMGPKVNVSADGSGLVMAAANPASKGKPAGQRTAVRLTRRPKRPVRWKRIPESALPVPKQRSSTSLGTAKLPGIEVPFRRELEASVPAELGDVLAFYRGELTKLGWQEKPDGAVITADRVQLAFASPQGPAVLKLGRANGETSVNLVQKNPDAATKADIMPKPGQARLLLGNMGAKDAQLTINKQTIKVAAGAGGPQSPKGPMLDLPPGKYQYSLKMAGRPARNDTIDIAAGDAWGLMVGPTRRGAAAADVLSRRAADEENKHDDAKAYDERSGTVVATAVRPRASRGWPGRRKRRRMAAASITANFGRTHTGGSRRRPAGAEATQLLQLQHHPCDRHRNPAAGRTRSPRAGPAQRCARLLPHGARKAWLGGKA